LYFTNINKNINFGGEITALRSILGVQMWFIYHSSSDFPPIQFYPCWKHGNNDSIEEEATKIHHR